MKLRWRFGIIAGLFLAIFSLYPQLKMVYLRGADWNGHYAYNDIDEVAYAAYLKALIDGRPRRNDPYTGRDDSPADPQPESLFSIQFAGPYTIAIPARILGVGAPWAMTISGAIAAFLTALCVFWLIGRITADSWYAMAASLGVFCFGTLAAGEGAIREVLFNGVSYPYFPGFRRYIPALAFPAFFAFCCCVWKLMNGPEDRDDAVPKPLIPNFPYVILAAIFFTYTVFGYFYIWTTAAAFLGCIYFVWIIGRPPGWKAQMRSLVVLGVLCLLPLVPYAYLLLKRGETMDKVQLLVYTRQPDLLRFPEFIAFAVLVILVAGLATKVLDRKDRSVLIAFALALVPFVVFNQQVITGRSLQPIHYQVFIGNYVVMLALFITIGLYWRSRLGQERKFPKFACSVIAVTAIVWGFVECHYTVRALDWSNDHRDKAIPVAQRLEELVKTEAQLYSTTVLTYDLTVADELPSIAPVAVLWSHHQSIFTTLSDREYRERLFTFVHYLGADGNDLEYLIETRYELRTSLFGWGRDSGRLTVNPQPIRSWEIANVVEEYEEFVASFDIGNASKPEIRYVIVPISGRVDLINFEQWYELDQGEVLGDHVLYRSNLRPSR